MKPNTNNNSKNIWNVLQPGDPYDIRKSMIAKLPDHPAKPMGPYLQLVCLFQAAQIQRLTDYLAQFKSKFRELERVQLDRHSYQIQIKQLTQKNIILHPFKAQNERLKDFVRRQSLQLEQLIKSASNSVHIQALQLKYENCLNELRLYKERYEQSESIKLKIQNECQQYKIRLEKSEFQRNTMKVQYDGLINTRIQKQVIQIHQKYSQKLSKLNEEIMVKNQLIENKNHEIYFIISQKQKVIQELRIYKQQDTHRGNIQDLMVQKNKEINKLHLVLDQRNQTIEQLSFKLKRIGQEMSVRQEKYRVLERQRDSYISKIRQTEVRSGQHQAFQDRVALMSMEIQRLNGINLTRHRQYNDLSIQKTRIQQELMESKTQRRNFQIVKEIEVNNLKVELNNLLNNFEIMAKQRNNGHSQLKAQMQYHQMMSLEKDKFIREKTGQIQKLLMNIDQLQQKYETVKVQYKSSIDINLGLQAALQNIYGQIQRLHHLLQTKVAQNQNLSKYSTQLQELCTQMEQKISQVSKNKQFFQNRMIKMSEQLEQNKKTNQNNNQSQISRQNQLLIQRQNIQKILIEKQIQLKEFKNQKDSLTQKILNMQKQIYSVIEIQHQLKKQVQMHQKKGSELNQKIRQLIDENSALKNQLNKNQQLQSKKYSSFQHKLKQIQKNAISKQQEKQFYKKQYERLNTQISTFNNEVQDINKQRYNYIEQNRRLKQEVQMVNGKVSKYIKDNEELHLSIRQYKEKIIHIQNTQIRLNQQKIRQNNDRNQQRQSQLNACRSKIQILQKELQHYHYKDQSIMNSLHEYQNKISLLSVQIERSNNQIHLKVKDIKERDILIERIKGQTNNDVEIINLKRVIQEMQSINQHTIAERDELFSVSHELQEELEKYRNGKYRNEQHISQFQQKNILLTRQLAEYQRKMQILVNEQELWKKNLNQRQHAYNLEVNRLTLIIKQRQGMLNQKQHFNNQQQQRLKYKIGQLQNYIKNQVTQIKQLKTQNGNLTLQFNEMIKINQDLSSKLQQQGSYLELQISKFTASQQQLSDLIIAKDQQLVGWQDKYNSIFIAYQQLYENYNITKSQHEITFANLKAYEDKLYKFEENYRLTMEQYQQRQKEVFELRRKIKNHDSDLYEKNVLLSEEIDRLNAVIIGMTSELNELRLKFSEEASLEKRIKQHLALVVVLFAQIQSLRSRLIVRQNQFEDLRRSSLKPLRVANRFTQKQSR